MFQLSSHAYYRSILMVLLFTPFPLLAAGVYHQITHGDQTISISYDASLNDAERKMTYHWLQKVTSSLLTVYNAFPQDSFHISIERSVNPSSAVPWGQVERDNPTNVRLVINPDLGYAELLDDWTAFHELSHLFLPYRGYGNVWFSEGLATYYQNLIQARSGIFDETVMWNKIAAGFERGRKEQAWSRSNLTEVSDNLRETRQFMRVHWSGVLYWLTADVELRRQHKGTLDEALKQLKDCCATHYMSAEAIAWKLDDLLNVQVFESLFNQYSESYHIPEYQPLLTELGVMQNTQADGVSLNTAAPLAAIRRQIYAR